MGTESERQNMKITLQQVNTGHEEIIIKYAQMTERIDSIVKYIEGQSGQLLGSRDGQQFVISIPNILYLESVEGITYLYTEKDVYRLQLTLALFESLYLEEGFFRCSKSMVINIYRIKNLKSISGNRIDVTMDNEEHVVISRHYAKELRSILRGDTK